VGLHLAFDFGAESGRAVLGELHDGKLAIETIHRFPNRPVQIDGHEHWDIDTLFAELKTGLRLAGEREDRLTSVGLDTWGVDFGLLDQDGELIEPPFCYRDGRNAGAMEFFFDKLSRERIFELTGLQFLPFNTLFQLAAMVRDFSPALERAHDLLLMPDLFHYLLTGNRVSEFTIATTSQLYDPRDWRWATRLFTALDQPAALMQEIVMPGTAIGNITDEICRETGLPPTPVIAVATHDTGSAVAAVPAEGDDWAYISSGTWSLVGIENSEPVITPEALAAGLTNEGGVEGTFRILKNVTGMWLLQRCRAAWGDRHEYADLVRLAEQAPPFVSLVDPDNPSFLNPSDMPEAIAEFCRRTGQPAPQNEAAFARCVLESLALKYRFVLRQIGRVTGRDIARVHVIGGGSQNELLCHFTASATGLPVLAGPVEATAIGNLLVQAMAEGCVGSLADLRGIVRASFPAREYAPGDKAPWDAAAMRFEALLQI
jgi:rhamnulokinase